MSSAAQISAILEGLGSSSGEIAQCLRSKSVQGIRNTARFLNPIIRVVRRSLSGNHVDVDLIQPGVLRVTFADGRRVNAAVPKTVQDFLRDFNEGAYADLEMPMEDVENVLFSRENCPDCR